MKFDKHFYYLTEKFSVHLDSWTGLDIVGVDREKFLQGQLTQDIYSLDAQHGMLTTRINRQGQIQFYAFILKFDNYLKILIPDIQVEGFKAELGKFIIMDDVNIVDNTKKYYLNFNSNFKHTNNSFDAKLSFYGLRAVLSDRAYSDLIEISELEIFRKMSFFPKENSKDYLGQVLNDTILNEYAVSYKKGCFLGQETVAKIENNRGASYYPVVLKLKTPVEKVFLDVPFQVEGRKGGLILDSFVWNNEQFLQATLFRDYRVQGRKLELLIDNKTLKVEVALAPFLKCANDNDYLDTLKDLSQLLFLKHHEVDALYVLDKASQYFSDNSELLEMYGVLLGRLGKFQEAILALDRLEQVDPTSVMAHTNKSLFYMKLGQIEKAEDEKSKATVKSFAKNADDAKLKKIQAEEIEKKKLEIKKRESMFLRVLEIDPEDTVANQGLGDVYYQSGSFEKALYHLEMALSKDEKLSVSYLLAGKCFEALGKRDEAQKVYEHGIKIASKQGDLMPANEMQSRLNVL